MNLIRKILLENLGNDPTLKSYYNDLINGEKITDYTYDIDVLTIYYFHMIYMDFDEGNKNIFDSLYYEITNQIYDNFEDYKDIYDVINTKLLDNIYTLHNLTVESYLRDKLIDLYDKNSFTTENIDKIKKYVDEDNFRLKNNSTKYYRKFNISLNELLK